MTICYLAFTKGNNLVQNRALTCPKNARNSYALPVDSEMVLSSRI